MNFLALLLPSLFGLLLTSQFQGGSDGAAWPRHNSAMTAAGESTAPETRILDSYLVQVHIFFQRDDEAGITLARAASAVIGCRFGEDGRHVLSLGPALPGKAIALDLMSGKLRGQGKGQSQGRSLRLAASQAFASGPLMANYPPLRQIELSGSGKRDMLELEPADDSPRLIIQAEVL